MSAKLRHCDAHCHFWDVTDHTTGHNASTLGPPAEKYPRYHQRQYKQSMALPSTLTLSSCIFVECISDDPLGEVKFVLGQMKDDDNICQGIVAYAKLDDPSAATLLEQFSNFPEVKGIRMILNHHPSNPSLTWPKVEHGDYFKNETFRSNFALFSQYNLSFDLQANPHQLKEAACFFQEFPSVPIIVNHVGTLFLGGEIGKLTKEEEAASLAVWREGMKALSELPQVSVKLSMVPFIDKRWPKEHSEADAIVKEVIDMFGPSRCMFASNYPVDLWSGVEACDMYNAFLRIASGYSESDQNCLFHKTAEKVYRVEPK